MSEPNTLFLLAKHGLAPGPEKGLLESSMWLLTPEEEKMEFVSLHRSKADRASHGGRIVQIREASEGELENHQALLKKLDKPQMEETSSRKIVVFEPQPGWNKLWPKEARRNPMAYKGVGYVAPPS